jgi:hypothetical protein
MKKLDRLGWAAEKSFTAFGLRIGIRTNSDLLLTHVSPHLPPGAYETVRSSVVRRLYSFFVPQNLQNRNQRLFHLLYRDALRLARASRLEELLAAFEADLDLYIAQSARRCLFVHAGVVGWKGQALLFPGHSCAGKSELVREFLRAGADYYSDEFAVLTQDGCVLPYARRLSLRRESSSTPERVSASVFGANTGTEPLPVSLVLLTNYRCAGTWQPKRLSPGKAILALLQHTIAARAKPDFALFILAQLSMRAVVLNSIRGEAGDTVPRIIKLLGSAECSLRSLRQSSREGEKHSLDP